MNFSIRKAANCQVNSQERLDAVQSDSDEKMEKSDADDFSLEDSYDEEVANAHKESAMPYRQ